MVSEKHKDAEPLSPSGDDPRLARTREVVLSASVFVLLEEGIRAITAARLHQRTGVARTTIYRHWPTQTDLVLATLDRITVPHFAFESTDDFEADLRELLRRLKKRLETRSVRELASATLALAVESREHAAVARRFLDGLLGQIGERVGVECGRAGLDSLAAERLYDRIVAPLLFRHVMMVESIQEQQIDDVVELAVTALRDA